MNVIVSKLKEVFLSVIPIIVIVLILNFTLVPMNSFILIRFMIGALFVILGLTVFLLGVDIGISPLGDLTGLSLARTNKLWIVLTGGLILGFFISVAEPGLMVLASQVAYVTSGSIMKLSLLIVVSIGLAIMLSLGFLRIFYNVALYKTLFVLYGIILILSFFVSREILAISFDASGSTTGILAVPFILAISVGISKLKKDSEASENDSFGLVAIASTGAIISVMLLGILAKTDRYHSDFSLVIHEEGSVIRSFMEMVFPFLKDSLIAIAPLLLILLVFQNIAFKLKSRKFRALITGFIFTFIGLLIFLIGVNAGFMDVGTMIGKNLALVNNKVFVVLIGFVLGVVTILAEPAVHVLTHQIEEVTSGYVKRRAVLASLALGVGIAVALSVVRILIPSIQLWHYLLPGYILCVILMFITPKLFVGIAFDAGGVATGPVTATFIMAFIQGGAFSVEGANLIVDGFGMIAMVAMTPILTLEILGLVFAIQSRGGKDND